MIRQKSLCALLLLLCVLLALAACGYSSGQAAPSPSGEAAVPSSSTEDAAASGVSSDGEDFGSTTLMIYMVGSDLEQRQRAATADLVEISKSGVDLTRTNILICAGGSGRWWNDLADPEVITILHLTASGYQVEDTLPLQSMGDPACLSTFVTLCTERFPADHYAMVLWDHGNGPVMGYGKDMLFDRDNLSLREMRQAMAETPFAGDLRLDWVGFDACLMASAELACVWKDYADYLVSSQETEPGFGWNYAFLSQCGSCSSLELACSAADAFLQYGLDSFAKRDDYYTELTLSVMDLSKAGQLEEAVNALFRSASSQVSGDYIRLAKARVDVRAMGRASTGSEYDLVDLKTVAENMAEDFPKESAAVLSALDEVLVHSVSNTPQCSGMSLYYPYYNKQFYQKSWKDTYRDLAIFPDYLSYLERYETIWLGTDMERYFSEPMTLEEGAAPSTYTLLLTDQQAEVFAKANYYILRRFGEGVYSMVYSSSNVSLSGTKLTATFDGRIFYFETDFQKRGIPYTHMWGTTDGVTDYSAMMVVLTRGGQFGAGEDTLEVEIRFSVQQDTGEMTIKGIYANGEDTDDFSGGKQDTVDLEEWDVMRFYNATPRYLIRDEDGRIPYFWDWPENGWTTWKEAPIADNPHFSFKPLYDDGSEYYIIINVMDVQGNLYSSELFPIELARAPEQEALPTHTAVWSEGDRVELLDEGSVSLSLQNELAIDNAAELYTLTAENRNAFPVIVKLGGTGCVVNEKIDCGANYLCWLHLEPGETQSARIQQLSDSIFFSEEKCLRSLVCPCSILRYDNSATLYLGTLGLEVPSPLSFSVRWSPMLGALAESQQILDAEGLQVQVLHIGSPSVYNTDRFDNEMYFQLGFENKSGSSQDLILDGFLINGCFMSVEKELHLEDGELCYSTVKEEETHIRKLFNDGFYWQTEEDRTLPSLESISEIAVCLRVNGQYYCCPVALALHGDDGPVVPDGELIYEDAELQIWLSRISAIRTEEGAEYPVWHLWALNRGEKVLYLFADTSKPLLTTETSGLDFICPGGLAFFSILDMSQDGEALSFTLFSSAEYETEPIELPMP